MAYKNNHYVPQLVLRRFSEKPSVYDTQTRSLIRNAETKTIFAEKEFYTTEIEKELSQKVETPFAHILNQKILKNSSFSEVELSRKELNIIKKFLLVEQMRVWSKENEQVLQRQMSNTFLLNDRFDFPFFEKQIEGESLTERWLRNICVIVECNDLQHIAEHDLCTYEVFRWAQIYNYGYLGIWDSSSDGTDFIITDAGMTSEVEASINPIGYEIEKKAYLMHLIEQNRNNTSVHIYEQILSQQTHFHENFYMFSISKHRMIVLINPFFRLYTKREKLSVPTIWPSGIKDKRLFEKNKSPKLPVYFGKPQYSDDDTFLYKIQSVRHSDVLHINALMLDRVNRYVGFASLENAKESIAYYMNWYKQHNQPPRQNYEPLLKMIENGQYTPLRDGSAVVPTKTR